MEMILFIGMQASGKTTYFKQCFFGTHVHISMDVLRTRHREQLFLQACLKTQQRFVIDNTNPTRDERRRYIDAARQAQFRVVGYFFHPDPALSYERNQAREGKQRIPPAGLFGTLKRLEWPVYEEGFDALYIVHARDGRFDVAPYPMHPQREQLAR